MDWFENVFFEKAGSRIKRLALVLFAIEFVVSAIAAVIAFFALLFTAEDNGGLFLLAPIGFAVAVGAEWLFTLPLYGFGELLEKVFEIESNTHKKVEKASALPKKTNKPQQSKTNMPSKKELIENYVDVFCPFCKEQLAYPKGTVEAFCPFCEGTFALTQESIEPLVENESVEKIVCSSCGEENDGNRSRCWFCNRRLKK